MNEFNLHHFNCIHKIVLSGPPDAVDASLDVKVTDDKARFSITVSDNSSAPAKEILYYLKVMIFTQPLQCIILVTTAIEYTA